MTSSYNINPGRRRKVYPFRRTEPSVGTYVLAGVTQSIDRNRFVVDYDFFMVSQAAQAFTPSTGSGPPPALYEYEEDIVVFSAFTDNRTINLSTVFTTTPVITLEIENPGVDQYSNVVPYILGSNINSFEVEFSAPFSGSLRYRAANLTTQPSIVERLPVAPGQFYTLSVGSAIVTNASGFTASYTSLGALPTLAWFTPFDVNGSQEVDVALIQTGSYGLTSTLGELSSNINNEIGFMVAKP